MRTRMAAAMTGLALFASAMPGLAHHSVTPVYDITRTSFQNTL